MTKARRSQEWPKFNAEGGHNKRACDNHRRWPQTTDIIFLYFIARMKLLCYNSIP